MAVFRLYVSKKPAFAVEGKGILSDLKGTLGKDAPSGLTLYNRYDLEGLTAAEFAAITPVVLSEPQVDDVFEEPVIPEGARVLPVEYLPGQFDQRADSCAQCVSLVTGGERPLVRTARVFVLEGVPSDEAFARIRSYLINPVESRESTLERFDTLQTPYPAPAPVATVEGFRDMDEAALTQLLNAMGFAMDLDDLRFCQTYFRQEQREPTVTELRVIDTYWSDHCRHTTFLTRVTDVKIDDPEIDAAYRAYLEAKESLYPGKNRPTTLMDIATLATKVLKKQGKLPDLDESEEINACSVKITINVNEQPEDWLLMFKNETHNHPTEIEPFGGAATCLGGAIRDPLSGRSYVYQAMRVTGAGDPTVSLSETLVGKLPQKKLTRTAASGYSSYGNQIGLATGQVTELYHPGYVAKRMEIGAVVGAAPASHVRREVPAPGDVILLLGGRTGRDGMGGATGSSKSHTAHSLESCGAEVQKGNPPEERKIQRLFRDGDVTRMIKRCNDFGAGGVSVAIGELADGLAIELDAVPKKYDGLDGTELAISESQERMAVVVAAEDMDAFIAAASKENLLCTKVAVVTEEPRLRMQWRDQCVADLSREFLNSNGAPKYTTLSIPEAPVPAGHYTHRSTLKETAEALLSDLNICSQKGLSERFDSTIGAGTVLMPFGGAYQLTPEQVMAARLPVVGADTASMMAFGFDPYLSAQSPFHGARCAVVHSVAKLMAAGGSMDKCWLSFQEYFPRTKGDPARWGLPAAALLGAYTAQLGLGVAAIGGKDSMSGSFEQLDVPPTLVSFAVSTAKLDNITSAAFKHAGSTVCLLRPEVDDKGMPVLESVLGGFEKYAKLRREGKVLSAWAIGAGGVLEAVCKMGFGNHLGFAFRPTVSKDTLLTPLYGALLVETKGVAHVGETLGVVTEAYTLSFELEDVSMDELQTVWENKLERVFPYHTQQETAAADSYTFSAIQRAPHVAVCKPRVVIPVFPGTNCEYDSAAAFERVGIESEVIVIRNQTAADIASSVDAVSKAIARSQIVMLPGGFSGGDEPEGSGKFILSFFRNARMREAVSGLMDERGGLMLGICNGFQALIKLGLVPFGRIVDADADAPTLTFNTIGRHQSMLVTTRVASNLSPWLQFCEPGEQHRVAISHGEGRFVASPALLAQMGQSGQIATQYVDLTGEPTMDIRFNPNGSVMAIEGITSPDGRILGKMGHTERAGDGIFQNVPGNADQKIFEGAAAYFRD